MESLLRSTLVTRVKDAVAAGVTEVSDATIIDMQNYEGVTFIVLFGTLTATQVTSIHAEQGKTATLTDKQDLEGTLVGPLADADDNKLLILDVKNPTDRYVRLVVNRKTANAVVDGIIAIQYGPRKKPTKQGTTVGAAEAYTGPAEGTA